MSNDLSRKSIKLLLYIKIPFVSFILECLAPRWEGFHTQFRLFFATMCQFSHPGYKRLWQLPPPQGQYHASLQSWALFNKILQYAVRLHMKCAFRCSGSPSLHASAGCPCQIPRTPGYPTLVASSAFNSPGYERQPPLPLGAKH